MPKINLSGLPSTSSTEGTPSTKQEIKSPISSFIKQPISLPAAPFSINFTVQVPENTPNYTIVYLQIREGLNEWGRNFKMEKKAGNIWNFKADLRDFKDKEIGYRYLRNNWGFVGAEEFSPDSKTASGVSCFIF